MTQQIPSERGELRKQVMRLIDAQAHHGMTIAELREALPAKHHGTLSGVLSFMHRDMEVARLAEDRNGCRIYVHPDFIDSRACEAQGRGGASKAEIEFALSLVGHLEYWMQVDTDGSRFGTDRTKAERNHRLFFQELKSMWRNKP